MPIPRSVTILAMLLLLAMAAAASGDTLRFQWSNSATDLEDASSWILRTEEIGRANLPLEALRFALPSGHRLADLHLENSVSGRVLPSLSPTLFEGLENTDGNLGKAPASGGTLFPAAHLLSGTATHYRGLTTANLILAPWLHDEETGELIRLESCVIVLETEPDPGALAPLRQRRGQWERDRAGVAGLVENPRDLALFAPATRIDEPGGLFDPRSVPSLEGSGVDMVIVTSADLADEFQELADYKTQMGIATVVRDLDWIQANYPQGADLQETLRRFLQDAYEKWGITYVLLAGDTDIIPVRYAYSSFIYPPSSIPTDLYYANLDGSWNADGDEYFCEAPVGGVGGDEADLAADVFLGRLPVTDQDTALLMIDKILSYSESADSSYVDKMTLLGEVLFPSTWHIGDSVEDIDRNGADYCEEIYNGYVPAQIQARRLYETYWLYPDSEPELLATVHDDMNTRVHLLHHVGHGFRYNMSVGEGNFMVSDALALTNGLDHLFSLYAMNCTSCAIDYSCLGEAFLLAEEGGGITITGSVRAAFPQTAVYYENSYYAALFADSCSVGEAFTWSHNRYSHLSSLEGSHRWTQIALVFIGDPSLDIWMEGPRALDIALTEAYDLSGDTLRIYISSGGVPVDSATVVAVKDGEDRALGLTGADGMLLLPFHADSPGQLQIHARANNFYPAHAAIEVVAGTGPRLSLVTLQVQDDPGQEASIDGNADGLADAGETFRLDLRITNHGGQAASNLDLGLSSPSGLLAILESDAVLGETLAVGDSLDVSLAFLLQAGMDSLDGRRALLDIAFTFDGGEQTDRTDLQLHAPLPRLFAFIVDDSEYGNGNGQPDDGEVYSWVPVWKNYGSTASVGWTAAMTALDLEGSVLSGAVTLPELDLLERCGSDSIQLSESDVSAPRAFELLLSGPYGAEIRDTLCVRRPAAPDTLFLDSSVASTIIDMIWEEPDTLAAGYLIYRSMDEGGPYELISTEPTAYTYFRNAGLDESTMYYFTAETVDSSGFRSALSAEWSASTNPVMLSGWPAKTNQGTASSLVIGDIDGDGDKEVVAGSDKIHAWHHTGAEVLDGDNDSGTYGVLTAAGEWYTASLALAQIDTSTAGLEIVGCSRETYEIYVFHGDGSVMAGWPQTLSYWTWATPAVADVDNDGLMEIFVACLDGNIYAWNHDGSSFSGEANGVFVAGIGSWTKSSPCLGQLDEDPELEIVVGSQWGVVHVWNHDGSYLPGWPKGVGEAVNSSISLGDLDSDGTLEIVAHSDADLFYVWNADGSIFAPRFPLNIISNAGGLAPSPALVDFEDDGDMEIVAVSVQNYTSMEVIVMDKNGVTLHGWPIHIEDSSEASPVVVDLDGDRELEILLGTEKGYLYGWEKDGSTVQGFPILTKAEVRSSPTIEDLDDDFTVEVALLGWDSYVYIWDMPGCYYNGLAQWKMFRANPARTGVFTREEQISTGVDEPAAILAGRLYPNWPNPFNPTTEIRFQTPAGTGGVELELAVFDIRGRRVTTLFEGTMPRGTMRSVTWNGRSAEGHPVSTGVYFARLSWDEGKLTSKMLLLK